MIPDTALLLLVGLLALVGMLSLCIALLFACRRWRRSRCWGSPLLDLVQHTLHNVTLTRAHNGSIPLMLRLTVLRLLQKRLIVLSVWFEIRKLIKGLQFPQSRVFCVHGGSFSPSKANILWRWMHIQQFWFPIAPSRPSGPRVWVWCWAASFLLQPLSWTRPWASSRSWHIQSTLQGSRLPLPGWKSY